MASSNPYPVGLEHHFPNDVLLSPLKCLRCAALADPKRISVMQCGKQYTRKESDNRCRPLASVLSIRGIGNGDTVAVMVPDTFAIRSLLRRGFRAPLGDPARRKSVLPSAAKKRRAGCQFHLL